MNRLESPFNERLEGTNRTVFQERHERQVARLRGHKQIDSGRAGS